MVASPRQLRGTHQPTSFPVCSSPPPFPPSLYASWWHWYKHKHKYKYKHRHIQIHKYTDYGSHNVCTCSSTTTARTTLIIHRWWYFPVQGDCCTILCTMHTWYKETANNCAHHCTPGVYRLEVIRNLWLHLRVASAVFPYHYRYTLYMYTLPLYIPYHYTSWNKYEVNQLPT